MKGVRGSTPVGVVGWWREVVWSPKSSQERGAERREQRSAGKTMSVDARPALSAVGRRKTEVK